VNNMPPPPPPPPPARRTSFSSRRRSPPPSNVLNTSVPTDINIVRYGPPSSSPPSSTFSSTSTRMSPTAEQSSYRQAGGDPRQYSPQQKRASVDYTQRTSGSATDLRSDDKVLGPGPTWEDVLPRYGGSASRPRSYSRTSITGL
jgi:hypothetical protein